MCYVGFVLCSEINLQLTSTNMQVDATICHSLTLAAATVSAKGREQEIKKRECSFDEVCVKNRLYVEL